jgi:hypothetical protein
MKQSLTSILKKPLFNGESVQIRIGNQIHYRNAARNVIGSAFQISNPFEDRFALNNDVNFDLPSGLRQQIDSALQAHCVARSLATAYLNDLGELHGGWQQDYAMQKP